jgi:hypothetical protein
MSTQGISTGIVADRQLDIIADSLLQYLTEYELMAVRPVCRAFRRAAEDYLWSRFSTVRGASSVIPTQYQKSLKLKERVVQRIACMNLSGRTVRIASDQITDAAFFRGLLGPSLTMVLKVNVGSVVPHDGGVRALPGNAQKVDGPSKSGKAHAKFMTGPGGVFFGSPNYTPSALSGRTIESAVHLRNLMVQSYFNRYFDLMRGGTRQENLQFTEMLRAFNDSDRPVSLALAPFVSIQPWLLAQLDGYDRLIIRMFLISYFKHGNDIVSGLNAMARRNPKMTIDVYVDEGQYDSAFCSYFDRNTRTKMHDYYVMTACSRLMAAAPNVRVYTQTRTTGIMHDKLILAEKDVVKSEGKQTLKRVIVGSSGFSQHVMHNENFDIMVRVDERDLYDYMMQHHQATLSAKDIITKTLV